MWIQSTGARLASTSLTYHWNQPTSCSTWKLHNKQPIHKASALLQKRWPGIYLHLSNLNNWDLHSFILEPIMSLSTWDCLCNEDPICKARGSVEMDKGDVPIWKEYFQLWNMQRASYMEYVYYAYVTIICFRKYVVTSRYPTCISKTRISS